MPYPSYIEILDTLSPVVTLGFGLYCAVNDTKPKDGKLSRAGKIALWGIIISGLITLMVKGNSLRVRLQEEEVKAREKEKQRIEKAYADSMNAAFEKATSDTLSRSVRELDNIRSASKAALSSLSVVADKQQAALENTRRGLNPLFPLKVSMQFSIDINEFNKRYPSSTYRRDIKLYLDTLVYFATKAEIPGLLRQHHHSGARLDTINIPKVTTIDPLQNHTYFSLPEDITRRFDYSRQVFAGLFLVKDFNINLRKRNGLNSQLTLDFKLHELMNKVLQRQSSEDENSRMVTSVDMIKKVIYVELLAGDPEIITTGSTDDFISLYDLQNAIMGIKTGNSLANIPAIFKLNQISIFTGFDFSRRTNFKFSSKDVREVCCNEIYARKITEGEIK